MIVYKITNLINNKIYIGLTTLKLELRIKSHKNRLNSTRGKKEHLYRSMRKYGFENFKFEELICCYNIDDLCFYEQYFIELYKTTDRTIGYNKSIGGKISTLSPQGKLKISLKCKKRWKNKEYRDNMIKQLTGKKRNKPNKNKGKKHSQKHKLRISQSRKGKYKGKLNHNYGKPGFMKGKKFSEDHKNKISKALNGNTNGKTGKDHHMSIPIMCVETGEIFLNISEAKKKYKGNIYKMLKGRSKTAAGLTWKYLK